MKLSKSQLRQKVISRIYENHNGNITGPILQDVLLDMIDSCSMLPLVFLITPDRLSEYVHPGKALNYFPAKQSCPSQ